MKRQDWLFAVVDTDARNGMLDTSVSGFVFRDIADALQYLETNRKANKENGITQYVITLGKTKNW